MMTAQQEAPLLMPVTAGSGCTADDAVVDGYMHVHVRVSASSLFPG